MDALAQLPSLLGTVSAFLVVLGVVVFVHEYGHYIVARWCGIHAEVFSIGFGKELYHWVDRRGTRWRLAVLPLGGYVKFLGDGDAASARADLSALEGMDESKRAMSFPGAALWKRALAVAAGPGFNFALSILIYAALAIVIGMASERAVVGQAAVGDRDLMPLEIGDEILSVEGVAVASFAEVSLAYRAASEAEPGREAFSVILRRGGVEREVITGPLIPARVASVAPGSPADEAGLLAGDRVVEADGTRITSFSDLQRAVGAGGGEAVTLMVESEDGTRRDVTLTPIMNPAPTEDGGVEMRPLIGVTGMPLIEPELVTPGPARAIEYGAERTWQVIASSLAYVSAIIRGEADSSALGGPIRIASLSGDAASSGIVSFVGLIALISASIGMINLFPIPVLDGGHLMFYAVEAVRGRPLGEKAVEAMTGVGLALVLLLMVFVTWNDISSL